VMSPTFEATERFNEELRAAAPTTIWASGCQSWYLGKDGVPHPWPFTPERHREMLAHPKLAEWELSGGHSAHAARAPAAGGR